MMNPLNAAIARANARLMLVAIWKRGGSMNIQVDTIPGAGMSRAMRTGSARGHEIRSNVPHVAVIPNAIAMAVARL